MKRQNLTATFFFIFTISIFNLYGQRSPAKFGKLDVDDFRDQYCPIDSNAHAYFLFDYGTTNFRYNTNDDSKGFQLYFYRHLRIKIVDKQGLSWGDIQIPLYQDNSNKENANSIKGYSYNLKNGKVEKTKLDRKDIMTEQTSENWETLKFAMPNLKEGSIIELEYTVVSDFLFNMQEWRFQRQIPILRSEYHVAIPEYFNYNQTQLGFYPVQVTEDSKRNEIVFTNRVRSGDLVVKSQVNTSKIDYTENIYRYTATNVPAFPDESFVKSEDNYLSKIEFELQYTKFPNQPLKYYTTSWEEVDEKLIDSEYFGYGLKRTNHLKDDVEQLLEQELEGEALLNSALALMQQKISWNGIRSKYIDTSLSKAYKEGEGNCADVNLNLVALLKELGIESYPVILSTQDNGIIHPAHPSISRFNYVIAMAELEGNIYLMDATSKVSMLNLIPTRCLNDKGRIIGSLGDKWVNLMDYKSFVVKSTCLITIDSSLTMTGTISKNLSEYGAFNYKSKLTATNDPSEYFTELEEKSSGLEIDNMEITGLDETNEQLGLKYRIVKNNGLNGAGEMIYFTPTLDPFFSENPFKLEKREFPVEFDYPYQFQNVYTYVLPKNLEVAEIPAPIVIKLPNNDGSFYYQIQQVGHTLSVSSTMKINKSFFVPAEYESLKSFFQYVIDKQNELVVLKSI